MTINIANYKINFNFLSFFEDFFHKNPPILQFCFAKFLLFNKVFANLIFANSLFVILSIFNDFDKNGVHHRNTVTGEPHPTLVRVFKKCGKSVGQVAKK